LSRDFRQQKSGRHFPDGERDPLDFFRTGSGFYGQAAGIGAPSGVLRRHHRKTSAKLFIFLFLTIKNGSHRHRHDPQLLFYRVLSLQESNTNIARQVRTVKASLASATKRHCRRCCS